jgi:putative addiction module killer protein
MIKVRKTDKFPKWLDGLRDIRARARILVRIERLSLGNPGDARPVGTKASLNFGSIMTQATVFTIKFRVKGGSYF